MLRKARPTGKKKQPKWPLRERGLEKWRLQLSSQEALAPLLAMALLTGILAGAVTVAFRLLSEIPAELFLSIPERYESLPTYWRFALPVGGALVLGAIYQLLSPGWRLVGVVHVLDRLHNHQANMPVANALLQFFAGAIALVSGQSVGREGPAVHLGAASGSWLGRRLKLPNNSVRSLLGCGVAAAIAASFNTPLAGVVFAMEVVMLEYSVVGFLPVILAAATGSAITQLAFGNQPAFNVPAIQLSSLAELPVLLLCAVVIGTLAALFIRAQRYLAPMQRRAPILRFLAVGLVTGTLGIWVPEILGAGYDTLELAMLGELALGALLVIVAAKMVATALASGLGIPGGVIGPSLFLGACMGGIAGSLANLWLGEYTASPGFYAMVGMAAMMAALLDAPLAALLAILELTYNPNVLFPGMMMIVVACLVSRYFFAAQGIFQETLRAMDKSGTPTWRAQMLNRVGVASVMERRFVVSPQKVGRSQAERLIQRHPLWVLVELPDEPAHQLLRAADLASFLQRVEEKKGAPEGSQAVEGEEPPVDLLKLPGERFAAAGLNWRSTLLEAHQKLESSKADALYISRGYSGMLDNDAAGIILPADIDNFYRK
ncbi:MULTISPECIES: chloride channel protein [Microbulbifer]|uniref:chloride channel protein n=1 Tax=Microbulbifer TaxID=48073 RepID=UPI001E51557B|nr:chloride channel protein [Microbulbifer sp. YPW16]UHQ54454.1 chloride channel protein [Microbulbifer sp. YPW16]